MRLSGSFGTALGREILALTAQQEAAVPEIMPAGNVQNELLSSRAAHNKSLEACRRLYLRIMPRIP
jgi:hypothetical protein